MNRVIRSGTIVPFAHGPRLRARGFTLVELMVSVTVGLLVTLAALALFLNTSRTNREMAKTGDVVDAARSAVQVMKDDIIHAGFWGAYVPQFDDVTALGVPSSDVPTAVPDPCLAYSTANWDAAYVNGLLGIPVESYDPTGASFKCDGIVLSRQANTDILVVRHASTCVAGAAGCPAAVTNALYFQASLCDNELGATPPYRYVLAKMPASAPDTVFPLKNRGCTGAPPSTVGTIADKRKFVSTIYYIRDYANTAGDGIPTLMRAQFDLSGTTPAFVAAVPLIQGLQGFRVEFGTDSLSKTGAAVDYTVATDWSDTYNRDTATNRGDGQPDGDYVRCSPVCTAAQLRDVVTVRIHLLARAESPSFDYTDSKTYNLGSTTLGPFGDQYKRHVFSTTIRLNNTSGRREFP